MSCSSHLLVFWTEEERYSVVKRTQLTDQNCQFTADATLVKSHTKVNWNKVPYDAEIVQCGEKADLVAMIKTLNQNVQEKFNALIDFDEEEGNENQPEDTALEIANQDDVLAPVVLEDRRVDADETESVWKTKYYLCRNKYRKCKAKCAELASRVAELENHDDNDNETRVKIGKGVYLPEYIYEKIRTISDTPEKLSRNLFQSLFRQDEVHGRSLSGGNGSISIPAIDPKKRDAIIRFVMKEFTGHRQSKKGKGIGSHANSVLNCIKKTLRDKIRYMNRQQRSVNDDENL